jgi:hypothetical protein
MKTLTLTLQAELTIPDDWEVVEHPSGAQVLKIGDQFVDFELTPLATRSEAPDAEWSDDDVELIDKVLDTVVELETEMDLVWKH